MSLMPGARRAELFADVLEHGTRTDDPAIAPFAALAGALQAVPAVAGPAPEFRAALRQRLVAVATVQGVGAAAPAPASRLREASSTWKFQRRMSVLAGGAAAVTAIAGVGVGASRSLPGDPFYSVKRATEDVQLATTFGTEAKGKRHLEFARTRLREIEALAGKSVSLGPVLPHGATALGPMSDSTKASIIESTLRDMDAETRAGANDLYTAFRTSGSMAPLLTLNSFTSQQFASLHAVLPALPPVALLRAEESLALLHVVGAQTVRLAQTYTPTGPGSTTPGTTPTPTPSRHHSGSGGHPGGTPSGGSSAPSGSGGSSRPASPAPPRVGVPTIPPIPTDLPIPTELPTGVPTLPAKVGKLPTLPSVPLLHKKKK
ncbi:MAG: hypothetical protein JO222_14250 [Frankiales bacterium]|nr:hypothetical protein [Frankiales bacterium]